MTIRAGFLLLLVLLTAAPACGSNRGGGGGGGGADSGGPRPDSGGPPPGGGSGVDPSRRAGELTMAESMQFCSWLIEQFGGEGVTTMCGDSPLTGPTTTECVMRSQTAPDTCPATIGEAEDCYELIALDPCILLMGVPPECSVLLGPMCTPS
jgi:hypothetical protein